MKNQSSNHLPELMFGILVMSSSGVLGRWIDLPAPVIIWLRCVIALVPFYLFLRLTGKFNRILSGSIGRSIILSGVLMGAHWVTYFYALKFSTVAIGMLSLFTYPLITAILEPIFIKTKPKTRHIPLSIIALMGLYLLVPEFSIANEQFVGILFGILSALVYSFRNIIVKIRIGKMSGELLMFHQITIVAVMLIPIAFVFKLNWNDDLATNWIPLTILALFTTAVGHSFFVRSFRFFSVTSISLLSNLTPLFGILLGWIFLSEFPQGNVLLGGVLILATTLIEIVISRKEET
ncbi:MAG: EamA family transporter [Cyclobacteriaceae bacterium]